MATLRGVYSKPKAVSWKSSYYPKQSVTWKVVQRFWAHESPISHTCELYPENTILVLGGLGSPVEHCSWVLLNFTANSQQVGNGVLIIPYIEDREYNLAFCLGLWGIKRSRCTQNSQGSMASSRVSGAGKLVNIKGNSLGSKIETPHKYIWGGFNLDYEGNST